MVDDGVIKFSFSQFIETSPLDFQEYSSLEKARKKLFALDLIGEYLPEKIGFGNLSIKKDFSELKRTSFPQFLISGTQTGSLKNLNGEHYTRVVDGSLESQSINCHGPIRASSESLTHAGIYMASSKIKVILHVHHHELWSKMLERDYPKTNKETAYGTKEMAQEVYSIIEADPEGILVMQGHKDGVIFYAESIEKALLQTLETYQLLVT
jgi:L-ribulose-5-phosphate 4-epimerase